jgi:hypothetical protein
VIPQNLLERAPVSIYVTAAVDELLRLVNRQWEKDTGRNRLDAVGSPSTSWSPLRRRHIARRKTQKSSTPINPSARKKRWTQRTGRGAFTACAFPSTTPRETSRPGGRKIVGFLQKPYRFADLAEMVQAAMTR